MRIYSIDFLKLADGNLYYIIDGDDSYPLAEYQHFETRLGA